MKIAQILTVSLFVLLLGNAYAAQKSKLEHFVFRYDSGDAFDVQLTDTTITWTGLEGADTGKTETDAINRKALSQDVEVIQWVENSGVFVTLVLDRKLLRTVSSGKTPNDTWLAYGVAEKKS